ncbi:hypothetical protein, partial [Salinisphaera sp. G21_0]|uniref:hypothetical protein n=1 Tax=Salinisphaera sp. G21_0 TaxID=2821094 RepID=UPI001ADC4853
VVVAPVVVAPVVVAPVVVAPVVVAPVVVAPVVVAPVVVAPVVVAPVVGALVVVAAVVVVSVVTFRRVNTVTSEAAVPESVTFLPDNAVATGAHLKGLSHKCHQTQPQPTQWLQQLPEKGDGQSI